MSKELSNAQKREWAQMLYTQNDFTQKEIAVKVGVSEKTISDWKEKHAWDSLKKSLLTSKNELLRNLYNILERVSKAINEKDGGIGDTKLADMYVKYTAAIENLETETNTGQMIETGMQFVRSVQSYDLELSKSIANAFDFFIREKLKAGK